MADGSTSKRPRFSTTPDLEVVVEDETFCVVSVSLMLASDVFAKMLACNMREGHSGRIELKGKNKSEFLLLLKHIALRGGAAPPEIDRESVRILLQWSDEYQILGLRSRCEDYLLDQIEDGVLFADDFTVGELMNIACDYSLVAVKKEVLQVISRNIRMHGDVIGEHIHDPDVFQSILPVLLKDNNLPADGCMKTAAGAEQNHQTLESCARALWTIIMENMKMQKKESRLSEKCNRAYYDKRALELRKMILGIVPRIEGEGVFLCPTEKDYNHMVSIEDVKKHCKASYRADEVKNMINCMVRACDLCRTGETGKLYRKHKRGL